jgi:hypothetical protein
MFTPVITACLKGCGQLHPSDITGLYDSVNNTTGWNSPNPDRTDETLVATLNISYKNSANVVTNYAPITVTSTVANAQLSTINFAPVDILGDGVYSFLYTLVINDVTYKAEVTTAVFCNAKCCIQKLAAKVAAGLCNTCENKAMEKYLTASSLYKALKDTSVCHGSKEFLGLLKQIEKICNQSGCGCGCS